MKILDKTIFRGKVLEIESLQKRLEVKRRALAEITAKSDEKSKIINNLELQLDELNKISKESLEKALVDNNKLKDELLKTKKLNQELGYAKGGLTKRNNELIAENTELAYKITEIKKEFEEFKKNKFIVKKLKAEKVPKSTQTMGMRSGTKTSKIISKVKQNEQEKIEI